jgi:hypothetical protein
MDMSNVRVHANSARPAQLNALAYAQGNEIHLGPGQEAHLPHEAWHVVQQRQGRVKPTAQLAGTAINDDAGLEREADLMGQRALKQPPSALLQRKVVDGTHGVIQRDTDRDVKYAGWGALGGGLAVLGGAAALASAPLTIGAGLTLAAGGALLGGGLGWLGSQVREATLPEGPTNTPVDEAEDMDALGHSEDEKGDQEADLPPATREDVTPDLYQEIEDITEGIRNLSLASDGESSLRRRGNQARSGHNPFQLTLDDGQVAQLARGAGPSYQDFYASSSHGDYKKVEYYRNGKGSFDFASRPTVYKGGRWVNPVKGGSEVNLEQGSTKKGYGITSGKKLADLGKASRAVHFSIANRIKKNGAGSGSPDNWTWHHLPKKYRMVLVDRQVHRKHGHNGGFFLWN